MGQQSKASRQRQWKRERQWMAEYGEIRQRLFQRPQRRVYGGDRHTIVAAVARKLLMAGAAKHA